MTSVTVIVPAYNEGAAFGASLTTLADYFAMHRGDEREFHYLIVDDGSSDETFEAAQRFARWRDNVRVLRHERNRGLGAALRTAFAQTNTDMAVVLDADLSYSPAIAMELIEALERENADIALASAYMSGGSVVNVPFVRRVLSREANRLLSLATGGRYATLTCMVRAYRTEVAKRLEFCSDGMIAIPEMLLNALRQKMRVIERPATLQWSKERAAQVRRLQLFTRRNANQRHHCAGLSPSARTLAGRPRSIPRPLAARRRHPADHASHSGDARHRHDDNDRRAVHQSSALHRANRRVLWPEVFLKTPSIQRSYITKMAMTFLNTPHRPLPSDQDATGRTLGDEEIASVSAALRSGMLTSTKGATVKELESRFAAMMGVKYAYACSSGTAAIHCAIAALDPEPGDEIITTPITDMGALAPILYQGAIPVFADVDRGHVQRYRGDHRRARDQRADQGHHRHAPLRQSLRDRRDRRAGRPHRHARHRRLRAGVLSLVQRQLRRNDRADRMLQPSAGQTHHDRRGRHRRHQRRPAGAPHVPLHQQGMGIRRSASRPLFLGAELPHVGALRRGGLRAARKAADGRSAAAHACRGAHRKASRRRRHRHAESSARRSA